MPTLFARTRHWLAWSGHSVPRSKANSSSGPVYVYSADHVRAHEFLCMLAYYVEWHMRHRLKPLKFAEENPPRQVNPVAPVPRSRQVRRNQATRQNREGLRVLGFRDLPEHLGTLCATAFDTGSGFSVSVLTWLTPLQEKPFPCSALNPHPAPKPCTPEMRFR